MAAAAASLRPGPISTHAAGPSSWYVFAVLLGSMAYQWLLCFIDTRGSPVTSTRIAVAELAVLMSCIPLLRTRRPSMFAFAAAASALSLLGVLGLLRDGYVDIKAIRDLLIPATFLWAGISMAQREDDVDRIFLRLCLLVLAVGLIETFAFDSYNTLFNTFAYYVHSGGISESAAAIAGQSVTLNGLRPEGIGRTFLPSILGSLRASSIYLEPVSLGNFAILTLAWGLAKERAQFKRALPFVAISIALIVLSDSRFGLYAMLILLVLKLCLRGKAHYLLSVAPFIAICLLSAIAAYYPTYGDNLHGRLSLSGERLLQFNQWTLLGLSQFTIRFGDMGYAYVITRFGILLCTALWIGFFCLPLRHPASERLRAYIAAYMAMILCISGTSLFAMKTSAILWFLFGTQIHSSAGFGIASKWRTVPAT
jgi:putative polymerase